MLMSLEEHWVLIDQKLRSSDSWNATLRDFDTISPRVISFLNPFSYLILMKKPDIVTGVDDFFADGSLLRFLHNVFYKKDAIERISFDFTSVAGDLFDFSQKKCLKLAFVGGNKSEIDGFLSNIKPLYPLLNIVYFRHGYFFSLEEREQAISDMTKCKPDIVICGMGTPLQEEFLLALRSREGNSVRLMITCGGFISQTAIRPHYYHPVINKLGLRWLQRFVLHSHVRKRVMIDYPKFCFVYLYKHILRH